jgi:hypothetical protein
MADGGGSSYQRKDVLPAVTKKVLPAVDVELPAVLILLPEKFPSGEVCAAELHDELMSAAVLLMFKPWRRPREDLLGEHATWSAAAQASPVFAMQELCVRCIITEWKEARVLLECLDLELENRTRLDCRERRTPPTLRQPTIQMV